MTPTISVPILICAVFAGACALRLLLRAILVLIYFATDLTAASFPQAGPQPPRASRLDRDLPALG